MRKMEQKDIKKKGKWHEEDQEDQGKGKEIGKGKPQIRMGIKKI